MIEKENMPIKQQREQHDEDVRHERETRNARIGEQVLRALGEPGDLVKVQARPVGENAYRVNVFVGADVASARVANSYFLVVDGDGKIVVSTPEIKRQY
jgi:hypothetical protein